MDISTDRRFLITGAGGAIAGAVVEAFAGAGARLALADLELASVRGRAAAHGAVALAADLTDPAAAAAMVREARAALGGLDGLVHTTGGFAMAPAHEGGVALYERMFELNVRTLVVATTAVLPVFLEQGCGFLAAFAAAPAWQHSGGAGMSHYAAAKAAVAAFLHAVEAEAGPRGVHTSVIYPMGVVDTPGNRAAMPEADPAEWIDPAAIARAILLAATAGPRGRLHELPVYPAR